MSRLSLVFAVTLLAGCSAQSLPEDAAGSIKKAPPPNKKGLKPVGKNKLQDAKKEGGGKLTPPKGKRPFKSFLGAVSKSDAKGPYQAGGASALLLEGPDAQGQFRGEWRQLGHVNVTITGKQLKGGKIRLAGKDFKAVCDSVTAGGLECAVQLSNGTAQVLLNAGQSGDPDNPDCVSCADDRAAGCCMGTSECCTYCAPADECNLEGEESLPATIE